MDDREPINYLALLFIIILGVTGGNLISNWITAQVAARAMQQAAGEASRLMREQAGKAGAAQQEMARRFEGERSEQHQRERQSRAISPIGRSLAQQCEDWSRAFEQFKSQAPQMEKDKHCRRYESYLETGVQPRN
ncbi:MAG: hypothetical protein Q8K18_00395 [Burkholderiales bacterium]|nr:hypothetical protein [Burkholderiales bacterium]